MLNKYKSQNTKTALILKIIHLNLLWYQIEYHHTVGIPMGTNCAPSVADLFLYLFEADFVQHLQKRNIYKFKKQNKKSFNHTFRYIDDVLSLNNPKFNYYIDVMYPEELEIKDTTDSPKWANYLDLRLEFDEEGKLYTRHDKRDD